jgi:hypothetical protein
MAFWSLDRVRDHSNEVRGAFEDLLSRPAFASRHGSKQWRFFRACLDRLLGNEADGSEIPRPRVTQYKFEVDDRLRRYYRSPGPSVKLVFSIIDKAFAESRDLVPHGYPCYAGYVLLVSDARPASAAVKNSTDLAEFLERVVVEAAYAEFVAYKRLPEIDLSSLDGHFEPGGPAYLRIQNLIEISHRKQRTISHPPHNPSYMRVHRCRMQRKEDSAAIIATEEYWYLRWWSIPKGEYDHIYQETNRQVYRVRLSGTLWLVDENTYPQPRSTATRRGM